MKIIFYRDEEPTVKTTFVSVSGIWYKLACAYSKDSDQCVHLHSLIRVLEFRPEEMLDHWLHIKDSDQTA